MFGIFGAKSKLSWALSQFAGSTGISIPVSDRMQVLDKAEALHRQANVDINDAVLSALTAYIQGHPDPNRRMTLAQGLMTFALEQHDAMAWSEKFFNEAMVVASSIIPDE